MVKNIFVIKVLKKFKKTRASVLIMIAILMPVFMILTGMITDIGRSLVFKEELNKACMAAAEEASKDIDISIAQNSGKNVLRGDFSNTVSIFFEKNYKSRDGCLISLLNYEVIGGLDNPKYIKVICMGKIRCFFLKLVGIDDISVHSQANGRLRPIK
jgi:hypothetical protein